MTVARRSPLQLAALASAAVNGLDPVSVESVHGQDDRCDVAWVQDSRQRRWTVQVPRSAADAAQMESAAALLPHLDKRLPFTVPVEAGSVPLRDNGRAMVYPQVEGRHLDFHRLPAGPGLAAALGRALGEIHNLDVRLFDEAGVPTYDADAYRARHLAELDRAASTGHVPASLLSRWERALENVANWRFAPSPVHGRLSGELVLAAFDADDDAATGRIVAVTGWDQARVADPADDFVALWSQASPEAFDSVLEAYAATRHERPDRALEMRVRLASELQLVRELVHATTADDDRGVREASRALDRLADEVVDDDLVTTAPEVTAPGPIGRPDGSPDPDAAVVEETDVVVTERDDAEEAGVAVTERHVHVEERDVVAERERGPHPVAGARGTLDTEGTTRDPREEHAVGDDEREPGRDVPQDHSGPARAAQPRVIGASDEPVTRRSSR